MFAPIAVDNVAFPQSSSMSTLDFLPETFEAFESYSNFATSSTYVTQSFTPSPTVNGIIRWGMGSNNQILGISESGGTVYKWDANTDTLTTHGSQSPGTVRNVVWDNVTNSWVICGSNSFVKISCADLSVSASIAVPAGQSGSQYPAVVAFGGKAYGLPLVSVTTSTKVAIFDLVNNTSSLSANTIGGVSGGYWGALLTSVGTIYFVKEGGVANNSIYEYNPLTDTGANFGTFSGTIGYGPTNLPNGNVFIPVLNFNNTCYIVNPVNKSIQTIPTAGFGYSTGICVGQNGHVYGMSSSTNVSQTGIWGFNTSTNLGYKTQYVVQPPSGGGRGFQDMFSLADGRLILMQGDGNGGRLVYYTYLSNPNSNTFTSIGALNPIMTNGKGV